MPTKFDPAKKDALLSLSRQEYLDPQGIISLLPIRPYHIVADVGCGPGYFTIPLGKYLFDGKVYAFDIQQEMLDTLKERLDRVHLGNVEAIRSTERKLPIDKDMLDGALIAFVLHEVTSKEAFLKEVLSHLRQSSWVAILEWYKKETDGGPPLEERIEEEEVVDISEKVGLKLVSRRDLNGKQYMLLLKKR